MFQIEVSTGEEGKVTMRGCADGTVELCKLVEKKIVNKETEEVTYSPELIAYAYYASIEQAFNKIARMRIGSSNATSLVELTEAIKQIRLDIKQELGVL
jgi:hypothetical protein